MPQPLKVNITDEIALYNNLQAVRMNGFQLKFDPEKVPGSKFSLQAVPMSKSVLFGMDDLKEMLQKLQKF